MSEETELTKHLHTDEQHDIADRLVTLSRNHLRKHSEKNGYISLDVQMGASARNKNAISVSRTFVGFMVGDSSWQAEANSLGLLTSYNAPHRALRLKQIDVQTLKNHEDYFRRLSTHSFREAQSRQGYDHFAFHASDVISVNIANQRVWPERDEDTPTKDAE